MLVDRENDEQQLSSLEREIVFENAPPVELAEADDWFYFSIRF